MTFSPFSCWEGVLIIYCCRRNYHILGSYNNSHLLFHYFHGSRVWTQLKRVLCLGLQSKCCIWSVVQGCDLLRGSTGEGSTSKLIGLLAGVRSLGADGVKASVPCWMLGKLHLSSMPHGPLFMMIHTMAACITKASWGEGLLASKEVTILCNIIMEMTSHYLCHILLVRSTCMFPHSKGIA